MQNMPQHSHMHTNLILTSVSTYTFMSYEDSVDYTTRITTISTNMVSTWKLLIF